MTQSDAMNLAVRLNLCPTTTCVASSGLDVSWSFSSVAIFVLVLKVHVRVVLKVHVNTKIKVSK